MKNQIIKLFNDKKELKRYIIPDKPVRFHRIITSFNEITIKGNVICKLSITSIISCHTRIREHTSGIPETNTIITKITTTRRSDE